MAYTSETIRPAQPATDSGRLGRFAGRPYIAAIMRRVTTILCAITVLAASVSAQALPGGDSLAPRAYVLLAMRARVADSVYAQTATWTKWAAESPTAVAPRFALAMLARYDQRYRDGIAWLDSATRVAKDARWRNAIVRERVNSRVVQGELRELPALMPSVLADSAAIPLGDWAESRYVTAGYARRIGSAMTMATLDSIDAMSAADDTLLRARVECLRAAVDTLNRTAHAERAIAAASSVGAMFVAANCQLMLATLFATAGEPEKALALFVRADSLARAVHDLPTLAASLQWRGYTLSTLGYVPWANVRLAEAIRVAQQIEDRNVEAWALLSVAAASNQVGDASTSSSALRRAGILFDGTGDRYGAGDARMQQAVALVQLGDFARAEQIARASRQLADSIQQPSLALRAFAMQGDIAMRRSQYDSVSHLLDSTAAMIQILGRRYNWQVQRYRGILALQRGSYTHAIRQLDSAFAATSRLQDLFRYSLSSTLSLAWLRSGDTVKAATALMQANDDLDRLRDSIARFGLRRVVTPPDGWGGSSAFPDQVIASLVISPTWLPTAFAVSERTRARALLKGSFGSIASDTSQELVEARRRVRATATSVVEVQRELKPSTALIVYAGGTAGARTSLMVITNNSARGFTLAPLDSLDRDIVRWLALLESGESGAGAGRQVAAAVLANALKDLPTRIKRLVIVPQGALYRVPFQALPFGRGVLGDRAVVTISPSVSLALAYAAEPRSVPSRVLAFGAGDTEVSGFTPESMELSIERSQRGNPLAPLLAAADEARAAAGWGRGSLALTGNDASEGALRRESRGSYTVLHAAAHALTSDQTLGANWLILRPDADDDGYVSGGELAELTVGRAMVVLSGCRTTGDFGSRGDAIDGLVAPLLARGVRTVVASHWAVSDRWTKVLMERFYQNLARGTTTAEAMNQAQTSLRREGVPARFWAAFSVIGDGALTFSQAPIVSGGR